VRLLTIATVILCLLLVPAGLALAATTRDYLATTRDIATLRFEIVELRQAPEPVSGYRRAFPGPNVTVRLYGVERTFLTLAELNFDLTWQGTRLATASALPNVAIPRGAATTVTVETNLDAARADEARARLATPGPGLAIEGSARLRLPNATEGIWVTLRGPIRPVVTASRVGCRL
jgi:hypothetical protein